MELYGIKELNYIFLHCHNKFKGANRMVAEVFSAMIQGIEGQLIKIQVDISNGLPNFNMIGYLSNEVKESKERVRTALNNIGVFLPPKRISVNFAPADLPSFRCFTHSSCSGQKGNNKMYCSLGEYC